MRFNNALCIPFATRWFVYFRNKSITCCFQFIDYASKNLNGLGN